MEFRLRTAIIWVTVFSIAMAMVESAVVIYLREIYYPAGFEFPLVNMKPVVMRTELLRELATLIMLASVGILTGKNKVQRLAWFLYSFAIWDIFYYVFLKILIHWPESWLTWDILFLIPCIWTGPVLAPVLVSLTMILLAVVFLYVDLKPTRPSFPGLFYVFLGLGSLVLFLDFILDFCRYVFAFYSFQALFQPEKTMSLVRNYIPERFNWPFFWAGECIILANLLYFVLHKRMKT